jgi:hypothetical protein
MEYLLDQEINDNIYVNIMKIIINIQNLENNIIFAYSLLLDYTILL